MYRADRSWALTVLCLGSLLITIDTSIVNVALPAIRADLGFSEAALFWVVDAYLATFGGLLLLGGSLADVYGHRRMFLLGTAFFTLSSAVCGLSYSANMLVVARAAQGFAAAIMSVAAMSSVLNLFSEPHARAKALGAFSFVSIGGGALGLSFGGLLTSTFGWHSIFLVNVPVGTLVYILGCIVLPPNPRQPTTRRPDIAGAVTATAAVLLTIYAIIDSSQVGWYSMQTRVRLAVAAVLLILFVIVQTRVAAPLLPLRLLQLRNLLVACVVVTLSTTATFGWFFIYSRYLQVMLNYQPIRVGLTYLPAHLTLAAISIGMAPGWVGRYGLRAPIVAGFLVCSAGLALLSRSPFHASALLDIVPGMVLIGLGMGAANTPLIMVALRDVVPDESGVATGVFRTMSLVGGAIGLSALGSAAAIRTSNLLSSGVAVQSALQSGYRAALAVAAALFAAAALLGMMLPTSGEPTRARHCGRRPS